MGKHHRLLTVITHTFLKHIAVCTGPSRSPKSSKTVSPLTREKRGPYITILAAEQTIAETGLWGCRSAASLPSKCVHSHFSKTTILSKFGCYFTGRARREDVNIILTSSAKLMSPLLTKDNSVNRFRKAMYVILCRAPAGNALAEAFGNYQLQADCQHRSCQT